MVDKLYQVSLLASENVGKKSLENNFLNNQFKEVKRNIIGVDFHYRSVEIYGSQKITFYIWIHNEDKQFAPFLNFQTKGAIVIILMYDITSAKSFYRIPEWIDLIKPDVPILLVGNKLDLGENREVSKELVEIFKEKNNISESIEISLQTGENVEKMFKKLTEMIEGEEIEESKFSLINLQINQS